MAYAAAQGIIDLPATGNGSKGAGNDPTQGRSLVTDDLIAANAARETGNVVALRDPLSSGLAPRDDQRRAPKAAQIGRRR